eukprot:754329-Hanusia_phi.AAC.3
MLTSEKQIDLYRDRMFLQGGQASIIANSVDSIQLVKKLSSHATFLLNHGHTGCTQATETATCVKELVTSLCFMVYVDAVRGCDVRRRRKVERVWRWMSAMRMRVRNAPSHETLQLVQEKFVECGFAGLAVKLMGCCGDEENRVGMCMMYAISSSNTASKRVVLRALEEEGRSSGEVVQTFVRIFNRAIKRLSEYGQLCHLLPSSPPLEDRPERGSIAEERRRLGKLQDAHVTSAREEVEETIGAQSLLLLSLRLVATLNESADEGMASFLASSREGHSVLEGIIDLLRALLHNARTAHTADESCLFVCISHASRAVCNMLRSSCTQTRECLLNTNALPLIMENCIVLSSLCNDGRQDAKSEMVLRTRNDLYEIIANVLEMRKTIETERHAVVSQHEYEHLLALSVHHISDYFSTSWEMWEEEKRRKKNDDDYDDACERTSQGLVRAHIALRDIQDYLNLKGKGQDIDISTRVR